MSQESLHDLSSVIDYQELLIRCLDNLDFAERMLTLFQDQSGKEMADLQQAFDKGDMDSVRRIAHRLAGASANAAAFGLRKCAADLRLAASDSSLDQVSQCLVELQQEWRRFRAAMSTDQKRLSLEEC